LVKASQVVSEVRKRLQFKFNMATHIRAWKHYKARPDSSSSKPEATQGQYCVYDQAHRDYLYTQAWIERLVQDLGNPVQYEIVVGQPPG
jgi:hypothetical protein